MPKDASLFYLKYVLKPHTPWLPCRDGLRAELKLIKEDIHRITLELRERGMKVEKLESKFDTLSSKNRATDPEGGEPKSQAYYIIKVGTSGVVFTHKQFGFWWRGANVTMLLDLLLVMVLGWWQPVWLKHYWFGWPCYYQYCLANNSTVLVGQLQLAAVSQQSWWYMHPS